MPVNATLNANFKRDLEKVETLGKEEFDQVVMGYNVKDVAPVGSQLDVPATGSGEDAVVSEFNSNFQLTTQQNWNMIVEGTRYPKMASVVPKGSDAGKPKYYEKYTIFANKGQGDRMRLIGMLKAELMYTDEATGLETAPGANDFLITYGTGRFEGFKDGHLNIEYKLTGERVMTATAAMSKDDRVNHDHSHRPLRRLPPKAARFSGDRE